MSTYEYRALKSDGAVAQGSVEGGSRAEVMRNLSARGFQVLSVEESRHKPAQTEVAKAKKSKTGSKPSKAPQENRLSSKQLIQFTEELGDLIAAGVQLDSALSSIAKRSQSEVIARVSELCYERVRDGVPLATALRQASPSFNDLYCNLVSAGEVSGALGDILKRQVKYLATLAELKAKLAAAMIYPSFLIVSGIAVGAMFIFFLMPRLQQLVESTGGDLPWIAQSMMGLGRFTSENWLILLVALAVILVVASLLFRRPEVKRVWDEYQLRVPYLGKLLRTRFNVQFVETLSNLLSNGLPLVKALQLVEGTTQNQFLRERISEMTDRVSEGALLNRSMERAGVFEYGLIDMTRIGEDTGQLASSMGKAGERLDREFSRSIDRIASVIQPAIILVMAALVGVMAYMMISVIYETISVLRNR
ncbi:MAG: type II secretion system F family protein [Verrucomicrobiota bacterium]